jgi:hypothetical protein
MRIVSLAIAMFLVFPIAVMSADSNVQFKASEKKADKKAREKTTWGEVKVVDPAARVLIIVGKDEISFAAREEMLKGICVNDNVIIKYTERDGRKTVSSIKVDSKQKGKKKAEKKTDASRSADKK